MISALVQGTLSDAPAERTASSGSRYWTASMRVAAGADALFVGLVTFSETAGARLARLEKGSPLAVAGTLEVSRCSGRDGQERSGWRLTASEVLTLAEARRQRRADSGGEGDE